MSSTIFCCVLNYFYSTAFLTPKTVINKCNNVQKKKINYTIEVTENCSIYKNFVKITAIDNIRYLLIIVRYAKNLF